MSLTRALSVYPQRREKTRLVIDKGQEYSKHTLFGKQKRKSSARKAKARRLITDGQERFSKATIVGKQMRKEVARNARLKKRS